MNNNYYDPNYLLLNKKYSILENIIDLNLQNLIKNNLLENVNDEKNFPWYFNEFTVPKGYKNDKGFKNFIVKDRPQFTHSFFTYNDDKRSSNNNSTYSFLINEILNNFYEKTKVKKMNILRAKANLHIGNKDKKNEILHPHLDFLDVKDYYIFLYYANDSDGDTILFDEKKNVMVKVKPKQGNILFAKGDILHTGCYPTKNNVRCLINIDLK
jgi:hypothetical protein